MKSMCRNGDVSTQTFISNFQIVIKSTILITHDGFPYASIQELGCICLFVFENIADKVFDISTERIKCVKKF